MRNLSNDTQNLFPAEAVLAEAARRAEPERKEDTRKSEQLAREFIRWCFSFGSDFRNSPDVTNFHFWAQKTRLKLKDAEEDEVLGEARRLFDKRVEQAARKADASLPQMNTMSE